MAAVTTLVAFWLWGYIDNRILSGASKRYRPVQRQVGSPGFELAASDVSVIVPTVSTKTSFPGCLRTWAANKPREIVIIGVEEEREHVAGLVREAALPADAATQVRLLFAPAASKREQFRLGVEAATGSIIVNVDDHILWPEAFLESALPCFHDKSRRNSRDVTPWEAAMTRALWRRNSALAAVYAVAGWCWVLAGSTVLFRGEILRDARFLHGLTNDYWLGRFKLDTGDDTFSSRWLQQHDWNIAIQAMPETRVSRTTVKSGRAFFDQAFRWERSTIQSFLRTLRDVPQIWRSPYVARKTIERVLRPVLTAVHILAWIVSFSTYPRLASLLLVYYLWDAVLSYAAFLKEYPYMWRQLGAVVLMDHFYIVQDVWSWLTLDNTSWHR
ncbi:polysaccharide synthase, partial [Metarhizium hybridum]